MTSEQIRSLGPALDEYLGEFDDCFLTGQTRGHLRDYVKGQLSDLPRKSVEPMAELAGVPARTLQEFLSLSDWDHAGARDRVQQIVARDHADAEAIGIVDESGHPKKGSKTACVQRQYCGNTGKIDNCVMTVHLAYAVAPVAADLAGGGGFRTMLDSDLYLPACWDTDPQRRREAQVPDDVHYRPKYEIALEQLRRARANGVAFAWVTADRSGNWRLPRAEWYREKPAFIAGLEEMGQRFVLEIPRNSAGGCEGEKGAEHVTVCQVRTAAEALLTAWLMAGAARQQRIDRAAEKIQRTQRHNAAACVSHAKARRRKLRGMGIRVERLTSCHPP